jgi:hypothetical protein
MLNGVKHLFYDVHVQQAFLLIDPSFLRMTKQEGKKKINPLFPPKVKRGWSGVATTG